MSLGEVKDFNALIDKKFFDQPVKNKSCMKNFSKYQKIIIQQEIYKIIYLHHQNYYKLSKYKYSLTKITVQEPFYH